MLSVVERGIMSEQDSRFPKNKTNGNGRIGNGSADWASEFLEKLLAKSTDGVSAVFDPEVVEQLASRKKEDPVRFESLRALLKRNGCRVAALDEAIAEINGENERGPNQTGLIISLVDDIELFHTADKTTYADIQVSGHRETWSIKSEGFSHWINQRFFEKTRNVPNSDTLRTAITNIEGRARYEGSEQNVFLRVGSLDEKMYLDICDEDWRAIEVDADGWRVVDNPPIRFRRAPGMQPLPIPTRGGSIDALRGFLNVGSDAEFVLAVSWILAAMRSRGPYPILVLSGEQGSAKSTFSDIMRAIIDPSTAPTRSLPRKDSDLFIAAANAHVLAFDNISILSNSTSDALCRLSTRGAHATRELFSDQKEVLFAATRPIIMNGIEEFVSRPDLADRSLFLTLDAIPDDKRRAEEELWQDFEAELPCILGALLDALVEGIKRRNEVNRPNLPRMADFALWASACETAFWEKDTFWQAYGDNRGDMIENIIESDPLANAVRAFIARRPQNEWRGTASDLFGILTPAVGGRIGRSKDWAANPRSLSGKLRRVATFLRKQGIEIEFIRGGKERKRIIQIATNSEFSGGARDEIFASASSFASATALKSPYSIAQADEADAKDAKFTPLCFEKNLPSIIKCDQNGNMASLTDCEGSTALSSHPFAIEPRKLYLGDNLPLLRAMASNSVDLITTDPPFNSGRERVGKHGESFPDDWNWQRDVRQEWIEEISKVEGLSDYIFYVKRKDPSSAAYLCFMAVRLIEMKRMLKPTGSIYIHCDKNASHHLRVVMDAIFGKDNFRNEIVWHYQAGTKGSNNFGNKHDVILFYTKGNTWTFNRQNKPVVNPERYKHMDENGDYYDVNGEGRRYYLKDGATCDDVWTWVQEKEFQQINSQSNERMGYPTQKPVSLLYRIIKASSNNGDLVLDPFCGSGTTLIAAEKLGRKWIGMDESEDACRTAQKRFEDISASPAGNGHSLAPIAKDLPSIIPYSSWVQNSDSGSIQARTLYLGDNLLFLRAMASGSVDLIATDPPFNTGREQEGFSDKSFPDKWEWQKHVRREWLEEINKVEGLSDYIFYVKRKDPSAAAYLCFMAVRLMEMHRVLKDTGSIYIHCDKNASHHLRVVMDVIFGKENFRNEIVWCYTGPSNVRHHFPHKHDNILFYAKSTGSIFNKEDIRIPYKRKLSRTAGGGIFKNGHDNSRLRELAAIGKIPESFWIDIHPVRQHKEITGYPTQKPIDLFERMIKASSNEGDLVLDPFFGSGTTLIAAEKLGRRWIGMDESEDACKTAQKRFESLDETDIRNMDNLREEDAPTPATDDAPEDEETGGSGRWNWFGKLLRGNSPGDQGG